MRKHPLLILPVFAIAGIIGSPARAGDPAPAQEPANAPEYVEEAPLPEGWPKPGPYDQVVEKTYPAYRAAFTNAPLETLAFWTLFLHIQKNEIPMTAPVEMAVEMKDGEANRLSMAFLYRNDKAGQPGQDGEAVEIKDVPAQKALSYAWRGKDSKENTAKAKAALEAALKERNLEAKSYRLLGYNSPGVPAEKRAWELQALLE